MKVFFSYAQKGGIGKSFLAFHLATYLAYDLNYRVLLLDLDTQGNSCDNCIKCITTDKGVGEVLDFDNLDLFHGSENSLKKIDAIDGSLSVIKTNYLKGSSYKNENGDLITLATLAQQSEQQRLAYDKNFKIFVEAHKSDFDIMIVDLGATTDLRFEIVLNNCDYLVMPVELKQECIDGVSKLFESINTSVKTYKNTKFKIQNFLGLFINKFETNEIAIETANDLYKNYGKLLIVLNEFYIKSEQKNGKKIPLKDQDGNLLVDEQKDKFVVVKKSLPLEQATGSGHSFFNEKIKDQLSKDARMQLQKACFAIASRIDLDRSYDLTQEEKDALDKAKKLLGKDFKKIIYSIWQRNASIPFLSPSDVVILRSLKKKFPIKQFLNMEI